MESPDDHEALRFVVHSSQFTVHSSQFTVRSPQSAAESGTAVLGCESLGTRDNTVESNQRQKRREAWSISALGYVSGNAGPTLDAADGDYNRVRA